MTALLLVVGGALVALALVDAAVTTLSLVAGPGPLTGRIAAWSWRLLRRLHHWPLHDRMLLRWSGLTILLTTFTIWVALLWGGWFLVFSAEPSAVVSSPGRVPAGGWDRLYFAAFTIFTLGVGDYVPGTPWAQLATSLSVLTGLFLVTLAITYFMQVVQAVVAKRQLALHVSALGEDVADILRRAWDGEGFSSMLSQHLVTLTAPMIGVGEQHLAYPVVHYFHTPEPSKAVARSLATLDDTLLVLQEAVSPSARPDRVATEAAQRALGEMLRTLQPHFFAVPDDPAPLPDLTGIRAAGIPVCSDEEFAARASQHEQRRRLLNGMLRSDA